MACPNLVSDYIIPKVKWHQRDLSVIIHIQIIDVQEYYLLVEPDHMVFRTTSHNKEYCLIIYFFGGVMPEKTAHKNVGSEIIVNLKKTLKWFPWLRLTKSKEKNQLISYDYEKLCEPPLQRKYVAREFKELMEEKKRENDNQITYVLPYDETESDNTSDDEECFYDHW